MSSRSLIVGCSDHASRGRRNAKDLEIIAGNQFASHALRLAFVSHAHRSAVLAEDA